MVSHFATYCFCDSFCRIDLLTIFGRLSYLFDFEDCDLGRKNKAFCWEKHVPVGWHPDVTLMDWEIDTPEVQDRCREFRKQYETANPRY